jgi:glycerol-3-phosphate acyltransferase PlsX
VPDAHTTVSLPIAIDAMGGDLAPAPVVDGVLAAARRVSGRLQLVGPAARLEHELARHGARPEAIEVIDAPEVVAMDEPPAAALRRKPGASIRVAMRQLARGSAGAVVSAGSTGATVMAA